MRDYLVNRCTGLIYSTALPPPVLGAIDAALDLIPGMEADRAHVARLAARFRAGAKILGHDTGASATQIVPVIVGAPEAALKLSERLRKGGFWATPIRPPTVPKGTGRVRLAFTRAHTEADVDRLLDAIGEAEGRALANPGARAHPA
jgi:8-amino-7-oxononanoate synthase